MLCSHAVLNLRQVSSRTGSAGLHSRYRAVGAHTNKNSADGLFRGDLDLIPIPASKKLMPSTGCVSTGSDRGVTRPVFPTAPNIRQHYRFHADDLDIIFDDPLIRSFHCVVERLVFSRSQKSRPLNFVRNKIFILQHMHLCPKGSFRPISDSTGCRDSMQNAFKILPHTIFESQCTFPRVVASNTECSFPLRPCGESDCY